MLTIAPENLSIHVELTSYRYRTQSAHLFDRIVWVVELVLKAQTEEANQGLYR